MSRLPTKTPLFKCTTSLSINERFTQLRGFTGQAAIRQARENTIRENNALIHQASIKNRRLAQQMERRPTVMAALKIKKKSIRQRLGPLDNSISVQDRLLLPRQIGSRIRGRGRGRGLVRGSLRGRVGLQGQVSVLASPRGIRSFVQRNRGGVLLRQPQRSLALRQQRSQLLERRSQLLEQRSRLLQLRENMPVVRQPLRRGLRGSGFRGSQLRGRGLRTTLPRGGQLRTNLQPIGLRGGTTRGRGLGGGALRGSTLRGSGYRGRGVLGGQMQQSRGQLRGGQVRRNQQGREFVQGGRGVMRGRPQRSRGYQQTNQRVLFRGFGRNQYNQQKPSKEELDNELDRYMSNSETRLDYQTDSYIRRDPSNSWR